MLAVCGQSDIDSPEDRRAPRRPGSIRLINCQTIVWGPRILKVAAVRYFVSYDNRILHYRFSSEIVEREFVRGCFSL